MRPRRGDRARRSVWDWLQLRYTVPAGGGRRGAGRGRREERGGCHRQRRRRTSGCSGAGLACLEVRPHGTGRGISRRANAPASMSIVSVSLDHFALRCASTSLINCGFST